MTASRTILMAFVLVRWASQFIAPAGAAEPRVELEIVTEDANFGVETRTWTEALSQLGFSNVRVRVANGDRPAIQGGEGKGFRVTGILTSDNQLVLPKGRFRLGDRDKIAQWLSKLRQGGQDAVLIDTVAFGLLPNDLLRVHEALAIPVADATLGQSPRDVAKAIADRLPLKFIADGPAQQALAAKDPVGDELQGVSSGTALAALLRPLGLALRPEKQGPDLRLRIALAPDVKEAWPIGWPLKNTPAQTVPELFKFLTVEIESTPLSEAMTAIGSRIKAPLLLDHNALAREKVNLQAKVSLPRDNYYYGRALDRLLFQAKLKYELRIDEAKKPLLWITTLKQP